jgi:predicted  nucleic acid-binding Zn-ribbon protein
MQAVESGTLAGIGSFRCEECGFVVSLEAEDLLPACPTCGGTTFKRASLFSTQPHPADESHLDDGEEPDILDRARERADQPGEYLAYADSDEVVIVPLTREWTRIGRSLAADVRFDDPTVSRRHALVVRQADGVRVLDDRSLNGVFVNGERVEWSTLADGDEILVGRHRLRFVVAAGDSSALAPGVEAGAS